MGIETAIVLSALAMGGAAAYSSAQESKASKKAAESNKDIAKMELEAAQQAETTAAEEAKAKLKLRQASKTKTILSDPNDTANVNKSILGV